MARLLFSRHRPRCRGLAGSFALVRENGAGKSTLMRIIAGLAQQTARTATFDGVSAPVSLVRAEATEHHHGPSGVLPRPHLTVAENVFSSPRCTRGLSPIKPCSVTQRSLARLRSRQIREQLKDLPVSDWQLIELAKAFAHQPRLMLMDEPNAVLSSTEAARCSNASANSGPPVGQSSSHLTASTRLRKSRIGSRSCATGRLFA